MAENYYDLLGVPRDASATEIKEAYRDRIKEAHPDVSDDGAASERTKRLIEAKEILTDDGKRSRYDRLGHEQFVGGDPTPEPGRDPSAAGTRRTVNRSAGQERSRAGGEGQTGTEGPRQAGRRETSQSGAAWGRSDGTDPSGDDRVEGHRAWESDRSYVVGEEPGMFELRRLLGSQQAVALLGTTFLIYPVLLAGSLFPAFPTAANLAVAVCTVLVVAYLQSIPQIGIVVFGTWSVLLPIGLFGVIGADPVTLSGVLAVAAVVFPFGLSVLTYLAINPDRNF